MNGGDLRALGVATTFRRRSGTLGARDLAEEGISTLAASLERYDTGYWSRYDLFPHAITNLANPMYHRLHIDQLRAMSLIDTDRRFPAMVERFQRYEAAGQSHSCLPRQVVFRLLVPRNRWLAYHLLWTRAPGR